jgi:hypothetical protein
MKLTRFVLPTAFILLAAQAGIGAEAGQVKEKLLEASHGVTVKVRMEGPYTWTCRCRSSATSSTPRKGSKG